MMLVAILRPWIGMAELAFTLKQAKDMQVARNCSCGFVMARESPDMACMLLSTLLIGFRIANPPLFVNPGKVTFWQKYEPPQKKCKELLRIWQIVG
jgi:hypothetical protein